MKKTFDISKWAIWQKVVAVIIPICLVAGVVVGTVVLRNQQKTAEESSSEPSSSEEQSEEVTTVDVKNLEFLEVTMDSLEKDINVYFTDKDGKRIKGTNFAVKLASKDEAKKLDEVIAKLDEIQKQLSAEEKKSGEEEQKSSATASSSTDSSKESESTSSQEEDKADAEDIYMAGLTKKQFDALPLLQQLQLQKADMMLSYAEVLKGVKGDELKDDNADGRIYQKNMEPGDYVLCYVPSGDYAPTKYVIDATIKAEAERKKVANIEKKKEEYSAAQDKAPAAAAPTENKKTDTIQFVEKSQTNVKVPYNTPVLPAAKASAEKNESVFAAISGLSYIRSLAYIRTADETGKATVAKNVTLYSKLSNTITIPVECVGVDFASMTAASVTGTTTVQVSGKNITIVAKDTANDATDTIYITVTAAGGSTASLNCAVSIAGNNTKIKGANGEELFADENGTPLTIGNYVAGKVYVNSVKYTGWQTHNGIRYYYDKDGNRVTGNQVMEGQEYKFGSDGALLTSGTGIDVSKFQGSIDWSQVKTAASFAIIRAGGRYISSRGLFEDPYAVTNVKGANANGIKVGLYFYSTAQSVGEAIEEASLAVAIAQKSGSISLPIYIDMEDSSQLKLSTAERDEIVKAFCDTVRNSGYRSGVYANKNWLTNYLTPSSYGGYISIWYARYNDVPGYDGRYDIWQYTSKGSVPGINGNVDMNISYF